MTAHQRLHLTAFGVEQRRAAGRKIMFRVCCLARIGSRLVKPVGS